jgi:type I restriction enzyme S subunit
VPIPVPPISQQEIAIGQLVRCVETMTRLAKKLSRQRELLVEHRQALITAAVTGALAIPGVAA